MPEDAGTSPLMLALNDKPCPIATDLHVYSGQSEIAGTDLWSPSETRVER